MKRRKKIKFHRFHGNKFCIGMKRGELFSKHCEKKITLVSWKRGDLVMKRCQNKCRYSFSKRFYMQISSS